MTVTITVLLSTYNGAPTLPRFLDSMMAQTLPQSQWKLIIVNNNSNDHTEEVLASYQGKLPLEVYFESRQGKAYALDGAFQYIEGELLILTDDDIRAEPNWLETMLHTARTHPECDIFSGLIAPEWQQEPPEWIKNWAQMGVLYSLNGHFPQGEILPELLMGPNSIFRTSILPERYIIDEYLGPNERDDFAMGEDTMFAYHLAKENNLKAWHTHETAVYHYIPTEYFNENWMWQRAVRHGLGVPVIFPQHYGSKAKICGRPVRTLIKFILMGLFVPVVKRLPRSKKRFNFLWQYYRLKGILAHDLRTL